MHVFDAGLAAATDVEIWNRASAEDRIVISKDEDFFHLANRVGDTGRLLWIRGAVTHQGDRQRPAQPAARDLIEWTVDRALKALNLVLQAGGFGVVAIDFADIPPATLTRLPFTTWMRVQRAIEGSDTACVLVTPEPLARSAGGLTLSLTGRSAWMGEADRSRRLARLDIAARVVSPRRRVDGAIAVQAVAAS